MSVQAGRPRGTGRPLASTSAQHAATAAQPTALGPLLDIPQAAAALHIPENTLRKAVSARRVPHTRIGKHVRFTTHHIAAIVAAGEQAVVVGQPAPPTAPVSGARVGPRRRRR